MFGHGRALIAASAAEADVLLDGLDHRPERDLRRERVAVVDDRLVLPVVCAIPAVQLDAPVITAYGRRGHTRPS